MIDLIPHIQYLVVSHDCVILPGWGAIVARHIPACVSEGVLYPPVRELGFNPDVNYSDGMLASSVARREGISYAAAQVAVENAVEHLRNLYDIAGFLALPRIGTFRRSGDGAMTFVPESASRSIANIAFSGLPVMEVASASGSSLTAGEKVARIGGLRAFARGAAAAAVLLALGATLSTPVTVDRAAASYASVPAPSVSAAKPVVLPLAYPADTTMFIPVPDASVATDTMKPVAVPAHEFYLIVSSHVNRAEASAYVAARPNESLTVLESDRRFRIVAATGATLEEAMKLKGNADFNRRHPDAWVYRK